MSRFKLLDRLRGSVLAGSVGTSASEDKLLSSRESHPGVIPDYPGISRIKTWVMASRPSPHSTRIDPSGVAVELQQPFSMIAAATISPNGDPCRNEGRTCDELATRLWQWMRGRQLAERFGAVAA